MNCSICGKEFGEGTNCQHCGVDRVTGLGNYGGYKNPTGNNGYNSSNKEGYISSKNIVCYSCGEIIPSDSEYCPYCCKELYVVCPKCGHHYSSQFPACNKCGTNRSQYYRQLEAEKKAKEEEEKKSKQEQESREKIEKQRQQQINQSSIRLLIKIFVCLALIIGMAILVIIITENGSERFGQNPSEFLIVMVLLVLGFGLLVYKITDKW